jgi:hypothetical protein
MPSALSFSFLLLNVYSVAEKSCVKYIRQVNLVNNNTQEWQSSGGYLDNIAILGIFIGSMDMYWDTAKLGKRTAESDPHQVSGSPFNLNSLVKSDVEKIMTGTIFDVFNLDLKPGDYNTALKQRTFLESDRGKAYVKRLEEVRNTLRVQGIRTLQVQTSRHSSDTPCSISNYDLEKNGFEVTLNGGTDNPVYMGRFKATINGFEISNITFVPVKTGCPGVIKNYICKIFIPFPKNLAGKIESNRDVAVQLLLDIDTFELKKNSSST